MTLTWTAFSMSVVCSPCLLLVSRENAMRCIVESRSEYLASHVFLHCSFSVIDLSDVGVLLSRHSVNGA